MIKNVKLANRVILAIAVLLGVAGVAVIAIDWASGSTSMLLELTSRTPICADSCGVACFDP